MRFQQKSHSYTQQAQIQRALIDWGAAGWTPRSTGETLLELGAGTGLLTRKLLAKGFKITATDLSLAMLEQGKQNCPDADWQIINAWDPLPSSYFQQFNALASSALLQWASSPKSVLSHWKTCLNPQGRLFALIFAAPSLPELNQLMPTIRPVEWRSPDEWNQLCADAGWQITHCDYLTVRFEYANTQAFFRSLHGIGAIHANQLNIGAMRQLLADYSKRFSTDKGVYATWTFLKIEARC